MANIVDIFQVSSFRCQKDLDNGRVIFSEFHLDLTKGELSQIWDELDRNNLLQEYKDQHPTFFNYIYFGRFGVYYQDPKNTPTK